VSEPDPILLHACCGPCSTHCVRTLREAGREPVILYADDNIDTREEWEKRLASLRAFAEAEGVRVIVAPYDPESWARDVAGYESEPEGGARCDRCFLHNLSRAAAAAAELGLPSFTTTLTVSPHKNSPRVFAAGRAAAEATSESFEEWNFKKKDGFLDSVRLAKAYGLYRQDYCGCAYSKAARSAETPPEPALRPGAAP